MASQLPAPTATTAKQTETATALIVAADHLITPGTPVDAIKTQGMILQVELFANSLGTSHFYHWPLKESIVKLKVTPDEDNLKMVKEVLTSFKDDLEKGRLPSPAEAEKKEVASKLFDAAQAFSNLCLGVAAAIVGLFVLKLPISSTVFTTSPWGLDAFAIFATIAAGLSFLCGVLAQSWALGTLIETSNLRKSVITPATLWLLRLQVIVLIAAVALVFVYWLLGGKIGP